MPIQTINNNSCTCLKLVMSLYTTLPCSTSLNESFDHWPGIKHPYVNIPHKNHLFADLFVMGPYHAPLLKTLACLALAAPLVILTLYANKVTITKTIVNIVPVISISVKSTK